MERQGLPMQMGRAAQRLSCWLGSDYKVLPAIWTLSSGKGREDQRYLQRPSLPGQLLALKSDRNEEKSGSLWSNVRILKGKENQTMGKNYRCLCQKEISKPRTAFHIEAGMAAWRTHCRFHLLSGSPLGMVLSRRVSIS